MVMKYPGEQNLKRVQTRGDVTNSTINVGQGQIKEENSTN